MRNSKSTGATSTCTSSTALASGPSRFRRTLASAVGAASGTTIAKVSAVGGELVGQRISMSCESSVMSSRSCASRLMLTCTCSTSTSTRCSASSSAALLTMFRAQTGADVCPSALAAAASGASASATAPCAQTSGMAGLVAGSTFRQRLTICTSASKASCSANGGGGGGGSGGGGTRSVRASGAALKSVLSSAGDMASIGGVPGVG